MDAAEALSHHGDAEARHARLDLAVNVYPGAPPPFMSSALHAALTEVSAYPYEAPTRALVAEHIGVARENVLLVNGVSEAFTLIAGLAPWVDPVVVHPSFTEPEAALRAAQCPVRRVVLSAAKGFSLTARARAQIEAGGQHPGSHHDHRRGVAGDLVVMGNPTNPTARLHPADDLRSLLRPGRTVLIDEAFIDVMPGERESLLRQAADTPGLLVARSLTKTFGLAGVRAGYLVGERELIDALRARQPHWSVNTLALAATRAAMSADGQRYQARVCADVAAWRADLEQMLSQRGWSPVSAGAAPFVLATHPNAGLIRAKLARRGVAVRRGDTFPGLDDTWARFAVRPPEVLAQVARTLDALD